MKNLENATDTPSEGAVHGPQQDVGDGASIAENARRMLDVSRDYLGGDAQEPA